MLFRFILAEARLFSPGSGQKKSAPTGSGSPAQYMEGIFNGNHLDTKSSVLEPHFETVFFFVYIALSLFFYLDNKRRLFPL